MTDGKKFKIQADTVFLAGMLIVAAILNLQFLNGSNINYTIAGHDEYLTVREVYTILHPSSFRHFGMAIISGDVLYYGRIMFYTDALLALIPYKLAGIQGLVYAIRMTHVLLILSGLLILGRTFLDNWKYRILFYAGTLTLYYSAYFFMVPKPEPLQLLMLALFFHYFRKNRYAFGKYFLFLGLAYGIKFNVLTILPFIFIIPFFNSEFTLAKNIKMAFTSVLYFVAGLIVAVPCLILSPVKPVFLKSYYNSTFANTEQYDDDASLGAMDWILKGWFGAYNGGVIGGILLIMLIIVVLYFGIKNLFKFGKVNDETLILGTGLFLLIPVILFTGRLWPHYLWTGYIFIFLGLVIFLQHGQAIKGLGVFSSILIVGVLAFSIQCSWAQGKKLFSLEKSSLQLQKDGKDAYQYLKDKKEAFVAIQDLSVPYPFKEMLEVNLYNPFAGFTTQAVNQQFKWMGFITPDILKENNADFIITHKLDFEEINSAGHTDKDSANSRNNLLIRNEIGRTIFPDTSFGTIKIYKVMPITN
jgi:hypothetical protein